MRPTRPTRTQKQRSASRQARGSDILPYPSTPRARPLAGRKIEGEEDGSWSPHDRNQAGPSASERAKVGDEIVRPFLLSYSIAATGESRTIECTRRWRHHPDQRPALARRPTYVAVRAFPPTSLNLLLNCNRIGFSATRHNLLIGFTIGQRRLPHFDALMRVEPTSR